MTFRAPFLALAAAALACVAVNARAQTSPPPAPGTTYRVFLSDGRALPSFGESVQVGDRLVFNLLVRETSSGRDLQLMSLPVSSVDLAKTSSYAESMRAATFGSTRGEAEYAKLSVEVAAALDTIAGASDVKDRLALAQQTRSRLLTWSQQHHRYRDKDVRELVVLFDDVIADMRAAAGESAFALDLVAGNPPEPDGEPVAAAPPTLAESIEAALAAARVADIADERMALLRAVVEATAGDAALGDARAAATRELDAEVEAASAYQKLAADIEAKTRDAVKHGSVTAVTRLRDELAARSRTLNSRRAVELVALARRLDAALEAARVHRLALDHYLYALGHMKTYERQIRPALAGLDGLTAVLEAIRDMRDVRFETLESSAARFDTLIAQASRVSAPDDLAGVHATILSTLRMAKEACARRRHAVIANKIEIARDASSAAAGALLLSAQARQDLVKGMQAPNVQ
jgi:hypothetical protein